MFIVLLSDCTSYCLVALNTVWYCCRFLSVGDLAWPYWFLLAPVVVLQVINCFFLHWLLTSSLTVLQFWKFSIFWLVQVSESAAVNCSFTTFDWFLFWTIENLLELIVSLMWLAFSEVVLICKLSQEKFVSSRFLVIPFSNY